MQKRQKRQINEAIVYDSSVDHFSSSAAEHEQCLPESGRARAMSSRVRQSTRNVFPRTAEHEKCLPEDGRAREMSSRVRQSTRNVFQSTAEHEQCLEGDCNRPPLNVIQYAMRSLCDRASACIGPHAVVTYTQCTGKTCSDWSSCSCDLHAVYSEDLFRLVHNTPHVIVTYTQCTGKTCFDWSSCSRTNCREDLFWLVLMQ